MSGVGEASLVLGLISSIIAIYEGAHEIYEASSDVTGLPRKFQLAAEQIPLVLHVLGLAERNIQANHVNLDALYSTMPILERCKENAITLKDIFDKTIPSKDASRTERYKKAIGIKLKSTKMKECMEEVVKSMEILAQNQVFQDADVLKDIKDAIDQLSHVTDEEPSAQFVHSGGGPLIAHTGTGNVESYSHSGSGDIYKADKQYIRTHPVHHHYPPPEKVDFSFRKPVGVCLGSVPQMDPELFVGRKLELDAIKGTLLLDSESPGRRVVVLGGPGGIGKTQLTMAYVQHHQRAYDSVLWLDATSEVTLRASFRSVAETISDTPTLSALEGEQCLIHVRQWLSDLKNTRWLLIYDNYDDPTQYILEKYYPFCSHGAIIVTTRRPDLVNGKKIRVQPIKDIKESLEILQTRSMREGVQSDAGAKRLAERLDGLPLALATAGAYLFQSDFTFERYLQEYERRWNIDPWRPLQLQEYQNRTLYTTWNISYSRLESEDRDAAKFLKLLAFFDHQNLWYELFHGGLADDTPMWLRETITEDLRFQSVMKKLALYCFLERRDSWSLHTCVHDWISAALNTVIDPQHYWYAFNCVAASIDGNELDFLGHLKYARLSRHASWLVQARFCEDELEKIASSEEAEKASKIAELLTQQEQHVVAEQMYQRALTGYEKSLGAEHTSILDTVNNLGNLYYSQGKLKDAEQMYQRALTGKEKTLGVEHTSILDTVNNLGNLYYSQGKLKDAE
ncbi:hypothetical protein LTS15_002885 [Exophiala xenobiotica]|nr:hypothetical protein LTS15_002885 [Exophiala xenobiotica]